MSNRKRPPLDKDTAYVFRKIAEMGTGQASPPPKPPATSQTNTTPQIIRERKQPELIRDEPIPQPVSEKPEPPMLEPLPPATSANVAMGAPAAQTITPEPPEPEPELINIVRLWKYLSPRDRKELALLARIKYEFRDR